MGVSFDEIYTRAVGLFDDPKITQAYHQDEIEFCKLMWPYLQNAISSYANPTVVAFWLADYTDPVGTMEIFIEEIDSSTSELKTTFSLDANFEILDGSLYKYMAEGEEVEAYLDVAAKTVTFPEVITEGAEFSIEQYYPGCFNNEYINVNPKSKESVLKQVEGLIARQVVIAWGENERNFLLDIRNLMTDTDFKATANNKILDAKNSWIDELISEAYRMQNQLSWLMRFTNSSSWGER